MPKTSERCENLTHAHRIKAAEPYKISNVKTSLRKGQYKDVRTGWDLNVQDNGTILQWDVPGRRAVMFVRVSDSLSGRSEQFDR